MTTEKQLIKANFNYGFWIGSLVGLLIGFVISLIAIL